MAYPLSFIKIDIIGDCFDSSEIWNTGLKLRLDPELPPTNNSLQPAAEKVASAWETYFTDATTVGVNFSSSYRTREVKASLVGTDGRVIGNTYTHFYPEPITGEGGGEAPLAQAAVVGSFRSEIQRGPGSSGRMYLPGIAYAVEEASGLMSESHTRQLANNFNSFINDINILDPLEFNGVTVILSSPVGDGVQRDVNMTGVDRKVDTQRRRANALTSDYYTNEVLFE